MSINYLKWLVCCFKLRILVVVVLVLLPAYSSCSRRSVIGGTQPGPRTKPLSPNAHPSKKRDLNSRTNEMVSNEVLVRFREPISSAGSKRALEVLGPINQPTQIGSVPNLYMIHSPTRSVQEMRERLQPYLVDTIIYVEPNFIIHADSPPNDDGLSLQWGLQNTGSNLSEVTGVAGKDISAIPGWDLFNSNPVGSPSIVVAIIDTGVNYNHSDLTTNIWKAPTDYKVTVGGLEVPCVAGTHGVNFVKKLSCDPMDDEGHGTKVAGIIGAEGNNAVGIAGVNWRTSIMPIKVLDENGDGTAADAANGIDFAIQVKNFFKANGGADVRILNNSYGWYASNCQCQSLLNQIDIANQEGMLVVAAAGNDGVNTDNSDTQHYPSGYAAANLISVAAFGNAGQFESFSNFGQTTVHLAAPGSNIYTTTKNGGFDFTGGTSFAAPFVSGAGALILARCPQLTAIAVKTGILNNVDTESSWGATPTVKGGRLNILKALSVCNQ